MVYRMARNFGGLLKICHLAEVTLAVEPVLAIVIFPPWDVAPLRTLYGRVPKRCGGFVAIWLHACEEFADNRFQLLFIYTQWLLVR